MLIYNKKLSVSPLTTHIPLSQVSKKLSKSKMIQKLITINKFYKKYLNKNPNIGILGLNPHNFSGKKKSEENEIILPTIKIAKKKGIKVIGPISTDTSFMVFKKYKFDVIVGMYHDQVLTPLKTLYKFNAINITLGLPFLRISPDHGPNNQMLGKNKSDPTSLIEALIFLKKINEN